MEKKPEESQESTHQVTPNLHQRIRSIQRVVGYIKKDLEVSTGRGSYQAVSHDIVVAKVRGAMIDHGVVLVMDFEKERSTTEIEKIQQQGREGQALMSRLRILLDGIFEFIKRTAILLVLD